MHPILKSILDKTVKDMEADPRILAAVMHGSAGSATEDEFSDVDPAFFVRQEDFDAVDRGLPDLFRPLCDEIVLQWPERSNRLGHHNFAFLLRVGDRLLQYDITITVPTWTGRRRILPYQFLFDKAGILEVVEELQPQAYTKERVLWLIQQYWVWIFIHAKYLRRRDLVKLVYVQQELFNVHLDLLRVLDDSLRAERWWPLTVKGIHDPEKKAQIMRYLLHPDIESVRRQLPDMVRVFVNDARRVCQALDLAYPQRADEAIREHIAKAGFPLD